MEKTVEITTTSINHINTLILINTLAAENAAKSNNSSSEWLKGFHRGKADAYKMVAEWLKDDLERGV